MSSANYIIQATELKERWNKSRPEYDIFVSDGIINLEKYNLQSPKILFLLKESNADFVDIAPINEGLEGYGPKGNSPLFWRYMRGYEQIITSVYNGNQIDISYVLKIKETPNSNTAYLNLKKKSENKKTSIKSDIRSFVIKDKEFLIEQIDLINPDVIYCGGTFSEYKLLDQETVEISPRLHKSQNRLIIDYLHLAHRYGYKTFQELMDIMSKVNYSDVFQTGK